MTFKQRAEALVAQMTIAEKMSQMKYNSPAIERLGIPAYNWWNECLHGVARAGSATVFPQAIAMAASFDTELMRQVATAISDEARAKYNQYKRFGYTEIYQGLTYWSPNINIFRDPRWGRGHETYGEDTYLTGEMGTAFIKGLQEGDDPKYRKLDATIKHYAVHSGPESQRHSFDVNVSDKDLYETYLWAFKYCIDNADPSAVMGAYNRVGGEPCCASKRLLGDILYGEFKYDGYVVSDCGAIRDINAHHHVTETEAESAALAVNNHCHLNCGFAYEHLKTAYAQGLVKEEAIDEAVIRLFTARFRLGMFDCDCVYDSIPIDVVECEKHMSLSRKMAQDSIVLLKNDGVLPLKKGMNVAVIGPNADDKNVLLGNYNGTPSEYYTLLRGIQETCEGRVTYALGCKLTGRNGMWAEQPLNEAILAAQRADAVIMCMGLHPSIEGEEGDRYSGSLSGDKADVELPDSQKELFEAIIKLNKPTVFVNVSGSCVNLSRQDEVCGAVVQCFYPGALGGLALADVLFGDVSPSGRLPVTFYAGIDDLPDFEDYSMENRTYKFYKGKPVYPFGHGMTYSNITESWIDKDTAEVKNQGDIDTSYAVLRFENIPHKSLTGIKKIFIRAGETVRVAF